MSLSSDYFYGNPPRCVENFAVKPTKLTGVIFDGHGQEINPVFALDCKCGCSEFVILGHDWINPESCEKLFVGPLALKCENCDKVTDLFDIKYHGYDAELGHGYYSARGEGKPLIFKCLECDTVVFNVAVRFEYTGHLFDEDFEEARGRENELFTWFSLHGKCKTCSSMINICDYECA